ncbi:hypothetical protein [Catelliglobosispora koreensis]|uniref:hypothetical protein n=1 Tax=Catelliglobosispora koreensis TaxID=129052 RepID=UPI0003A1D94D|nr:hypothetical protein [Catelliglobosispora koreensis]
MSKRKKNKSFRAEEEHISEHAVEESRQEAFAAREKATRTQISAGQTKVQRLNRGNQPRGGR